jgi:hypothetical protein
VVDSNGNEFFGCHRGHTQNLNVQNPHPGRVPFWGSTSEGKRIHYEMLGWQLDTESKTQPALDATRQRTPLDSARRVGDVVLYWMPEDRYTAYCKDRAAAGARLREDVAPAFVERGYSLQERHGHYTGSRNLYFQRPDHGAEYR